jgi:hypothetical protein
MAENGVATKIWAKTIPINDSVNEIFTWDPMIPYGPMILSNKSPDTNGGKPIGTVVKKKQIY